MSSNTRKMGFSQARPVPDTPVELAQSPPEEECQMRTELLQHLAESDYVSEPEEVYQCAWERIVNTWGEVADPTTIENLLRGKQGKVIAQRVIEQTRCPISDEELLCALNRELEEYNNYWRHQLEVERIATETRTARRGGM